MIIGSVIMFHVAWGIGLWVPLAFYGILLWLIGAWFPFMGARNNLKKKKYKITKRHFKRAEIYLPLKKSPSPT